MTEHLLKEIKRKISQDGWNVGQIQTGNLLNVKQGASHLS
jgi:hypothetical protein